MSTSIILSNPLDVKPFPSATPPIAKNTIVHANCSKSSFQRLINHRSTNKLKRQTFFKTPVPKNATMGIMAITPISPTQSSTSVSTHHSAIVTRHTTVTHHCFFVNASLVGRIGRISISPSPSGERAGWYEMRRRIQMRIIEMKETGRATANQEAQSSRGSIASSAIRF